MLPRFPVSDARVHGPTRSSARQTTADRRYKYFAEDVRASAEFNECCIDTGADARDVLVVSGCRRRQERDQYCLDHPREPGTDAQATIDGMHFNLFNANTVLAATATYGPNWLRPSGVLGPRLFKRGVQVDF